MFILSYLRFIYADCCNPKGNKMVIKEMKRKSQHGPYEDTEGLFNPPGAF